jgi:hypothetical protein
MVDRELGGLASHQLNYNKINIICDIIRNYIVCAGGFAAKPAATSHARLGIHAAPRFSAANSQLMSFSMTPFT